MMCNYWNNNISRNDKPANNRFFLCVLIKIYENKVFLKIVIFGCGRFGLTKTKLL